MDGSEPGDLIAAATISGAPVEMQARTVRYERAILLRVYCQNLSHIELGYSARPRQLRNLVTGTAIIGGWTGMYYTEAIDGRTRLWGGNHRRTQFKEHT